MLREVNWRKNQFETVMAHKVASVSHSLLEKFRREDFWLNWDYPHASTLWNVEILELKVSKDGP